MCKNRAKYGEKSKLWLIMGLAARVIFHEMCVRHYGSLIRVS